MTSDLGPSKRNKGRPERFVLWFLLGLTPWLLVNAIYAELPILVLAAPEGYEIASSLALVVQIANIVPLIFLWLHSIRHTIVNYRFWVIVNSLFAVATSLVIATGLMNKLVVVMGGREFSISILLCMLAAGIVGCLAMVLYFPLVNLYGNKFLTSVFASGCSASALVASSFAVAQDAGENPRFSIEVYFVIMTAVLLVSLMSFFLISRQRKFSEITREYIRKSTISIDDERLDDLVNDTDSEDEDDLPKRDFVLSLIRRNPGVFVHQLIYNFTKFMLIGATPFALAKFTNSETLLLYLIFTGSIGDILGRFLSGVELASFRHLNVLSAIVSTFFAFLLYFSVRNDHGMPESLGIILITVNFLFVFSQGFSNTTVWHIIASKKHQENVEQLTQLSAMTQQIGAILGTVATFILVQTQIIT